VTARILYGKPIAAEIMTEVKIRSEALRSCGILPHLAFVMLGHSAEAEMYAARLERLAHRAGIRVTRIVLADTVTLEELDRAVTELNDDNGVDGILVQMPLPPHLTYEDLSAIISPRKDVDGITIENAGRLYLGLRSGVASTAVAMMDILQYAGVDPFRMHAVVIGRSQVVGHPVAELLLHQDATVTVVHRQTPDISVLTRLADVLFVGAGEPRLVTADMIRPGVVVIDAGINVTPDGIVGDVDFEGCLGVAAAITPVPGGVGPVTNAVLLRHLVDSAEQRPR
jgi:methylenetetrahydrofolate dehydrogenase (NADP+)/methenyltetrahydrofolate cyclohydrolase